MPRNRSHALGTSPASSRILSQVRSFVLSSRVDLAIHGPATSLDPDTLQTPLSGHAVADDVRSSPVNVRVSFPSPGAQPRTMLAMPPPWTRLCPSGVLQGPWRTCSLAEQTQLRHSENICWICFCIRDICLVG